MNGQDVAREALEYRKWISDNWPKFVRPDVPVPISLIRNTREILSASKVVIWQKEIYPIAVRGHEQFRGSRLLERMTKYDIEFWYFNGFKPVVGKAQEAVQAVILIPLPDESLTFEMISGQHQSGDYRARFQTVGINQEVTPQMSSVLAMREFLEQRLAANEPVVLPRNERRLLAKQNNAPPEIRLISLRARESSGWHTPQSREYRHRWIQSGHWRRLQEPLKRDSKRSGGKQGDEVVWVIPHEKGPLGAPLLQQRPTAYVVAR